MNGVATLIPRSFIICSVILIVTGVAQYLVRPRSPGEKLVEKIANRATITAILSIVVGVAGLLLGLGVVKMPHFS